MASEEHHANTVTLVRDAPGRLLGGSTTVQNMCRVRTCIGAPSPRAAS